MTDAILARVRGEFQEMPGLCLTVAEAARLWQMDPAWCEFALSALVQQRSLIRTKHGAYVQSS